MMLNMDLTKRAVVLSSEHEWQSSPALGVSRIRLEREAAESGHATSLVRYKPGASFERHVHPRGEEIFVLEGVFSDEDGDYPAGTYLRNPAGSAHAPYSTDGCLLFVKLAQFSDDDRKVVRKNTTETPWLPGQGGLKVMPLHEFSDGVRATSTALVHWPAGERFQPHRHFGGEEILVLSGEFIDEHGRYPKMSWLRSPDQSVHFPYVEEETVILVKVGHLPFLDQTDRQVWDLKRL